MRRPPGPADLQRRRGGGGSNPPPPSQAPHKPLPGPSQGLGSPGKGPGKGLGGAWEGPGGVAWEGAWEGPALDGRGRRPPRAAGRRENDAIMMLELMHKCCQNAAKMVLK